jgi:hypothetical protein
MLRAAVYELQHMTAVAFQYYHIRTLEISGDVVLPSYTLDSIYISFSVTA